MEKVKILGNEYTSQELLTYIQESPANVKKILDGLNQNNIDFFIKNQEIMDFLNEGYSDRIIGIIQNLSY